MAHAAGTIGYELMCALAPRVPVRRGELNPAHCGAQHTMGIIGTIIVGLIVGALARFVMPGEQKMGWILTILLGIAGSLLAGFLGQALGWYAAGQGAGWIASVLGRVRAALRRGQAAGSTADALTASCAATRLRVQPDEVEFNAIRAQGAGGQNVNKVSNAAHLRFDIRASSLPEALKARLLALADRASAVTAWSSSRPRTTAACR